MTVKDLKEKLSECPDDMVIITHGYEDGYDEIVEIKDIDVFKRKSPSWWEGEYTKIDNGSEAKKMIFLRSRSDRF